MNLKKLIAKMLIIILSTSVLFESAAYCMQTPINKKTEEKDNCAICFCEIEEDEAIKELRNCKHRFHTNCINEQFKNHNSLIHEDGIRFNGHICALCRADIHVNDINNEQPKKEQPEEEDKKIENCPICDHPIHGNDNVNEDSGIKIHQACIGNQNHLYERGAHTINRVECSLCRNRIANSERSRTLDCGHQFHRNCVHNHFVRRDNRCPECQLEAISPEEQRELKNRDRTNTMRSFNDSMRRLRERMEVFERCAHCNERVNLTQALRMENGNTYHNHCYLAQQRAAYVPNYPPQDPNRQNGGNARWLVSAAVIGCALLVTTILLRKFVLKSNVLNRFKPFNMLRKYNPLNLFKRKSIPTV